MTGRLLTVGQPASGKRGGLAGAAEACLAEKIAVSALGISDEFVKSRAPSGGDSVCSSEEASSGRC